jgi:hypothetical protein
MLAEVVVVNLNHQLEVDWVEVLALALEQYLIVVVVVEEELVSQLMAHRVSSS